MSMVQSSLVLADQGFTSSTPTETIANKSAIRRLWNYKVKLDYVRTPIPKKGLRKIWRKMFENDRSELLIAYTFGGKMEEYSDTAIPYPHRAGVLYQLFKGAYVNYIDLDLGVGSETYEEASVWGERYWKRENFKKLIRIKAKVDPENFFRHPQSIPVFD
uniref:Putative berberine/berberine-like protein n=1 Tax=Helianthus annuus TaxID=4232 RepID=A0A251UF21_HELAN